MATTQVTWDASDLAAMGQQYAVLDEVLQVEMRKAVLNSTYAVEGLAKKYVPQGDTKQLIRSIRSDIDTKVVGVMTGIVSANTPYARAIEFNWKSESGKWPPPGVLLTWMAKRGIPESAEFPIRRAIARRGYKNYPNPDGARPYLTRALDELKSDIGKELAAVPVRMMNRLRGNP